MSGRLCEAKPETKNPIYIGWGEKMEMHQYDKNYGTLFYYSHLHQIHYNVNRIHYVQQIHRIFIVQQIHCFVQQINRLPFYILSSLGSLPYGVSEIASTLPDEVYSKSNLQYAKTQAPSSPIESYLTKCFKVFFTFTSFSFLYIYIAFYYRKFVMYWICVKNTYEVSY